MLLETSKQSRSSVWLEIDLGKLKGNLAYLRSQLDPIIGILAIVKANAYGHGMVECARVLEPSVAYFGVSDITEALKLRQNGISKPILILGFVNPEDVPLVIENDLTLSLSDSEHAETLNSLAAAYGADKKVKVHLKIDTGMSRLGFSCRSAFDEILSLRQFSSLDIEGIFTHFAVADKKGDQFTEEQLDKFEALLSQLEKAGMTFKWRHSANSGGILNCKDAHLNLVRPGISLYGLYEDSAYTKVLQPVLNWKTTVKLVKELAPGDTVSYGRHFKTNQKTKVAILPVGYSHGYPVALSSKGRVIIRGKIYPVAGRVCMDYTIVALGPDSDVQEGDEVILIGSSGNASVTAIELANLAGTISYEIVTRLNLTLPRYYHE